MIHSLQVHREQRQQQARHDRQLVAAEEFSTDCAIMLGALLDRHELPAALRAKIANAVESLRAVSACITEGN